LGVIIIGGNSGEIYGRKIISYKIFQEIGLKNTQEKSSLIWG